MYRFPYQAAVPTIELSLGRGAGEWDSRNKDAVYGVVEQARIGNSHVDYSVLPVLRARYADAPTAELRAEDLAMVLAAVVQAGANGLVIQGDPFADSPAKAAGFAAYLASTLGPTVRAAVTDNCACAVASCSDAGNCVGFRPRLPHDRVVNDTVPACYCRLREDEEARKRSHLGSGQHTAVVTIGVVGANAKATARRHEIGTPDVTVMTVGTRNRRNAFGGFQVDDSRNLKLICQSGSLPKWSRKFCFSEAILLPTFALPPPRASSPRDFCHPTALIDLRLRPTFAMSMHFHARGANGEPTFATPVPYGGSKSVAYDDRR